MTRAKRKRITDAIYNTLSVLGMMSALVLYVIF